MNSIFVLVCNFTREDESKVGERNMEPHHRCRKTYFVEAMKTVFEDFKLSPNQHLFAVQCINKVTNLSIYSYKNKLGGWNIVKNKFIQLPKKNGKPDYELMENLTSSLKKLAIKNVVLYVEKRKKELTKLTENANA